MSAPPAELVDEGRIGSRERGARLRGDGLTVNDELVLTPIVVDDAPLSDEATQLADHPRARPDHALLVGQGTAELGRAERAVALVSPDLELGLQAGAGLLRALGADRPGAESEISALGQLDRVIQAGSGDVGVRVRSLVDHGGLPIVVDVAGGHGALLVLVLVGGNSGVLLGLGPGAAKIVRVSLTERRPGDRVELGVLIRQGLSHSR